MMQHYFKCGWGSRPHTEIAKSRPPIPVKLFQECLKHGFYCCSQKTFVTLLQRQVSWEPGLVGLNFPCFEQPQREREK
jgi:hypothetical protein